MREFESRDAASFKFAEVLYRKADWVATVTINRPHNYNAYSTAALRDLATAVQDAAFDDAIGVALDFHVITLRTQEFLNGLRKIFIIINEQYCFHACRARCNVLTLPQYFSRKEIY